MMMKICRIVLGFLALSAVAQGKASIIKTVCHGHLLTLDCPRNTAIDILSANYGRTHGNICNPTNKSIQETHCISKTSKLIIVERCSKKRHCSIMTRSKYMGGDPCPGVMKYVDIIYRCVSSSNPVVTVTPPPTRSQITNKESTMLYTTPILYIEDVTRATARIVKPNTTVKTEAVSKKHGGGFFRSMLLLVALVKDKPKHSLLSVLTGVAAGTVIILVTVLACVCVKKRREKKAGGNYNNESNIKKAEVVEVEKSELLGGKKTGRNSADSNQSVDDHVDSAFGDDEPYRRKSEEFEMSNNLAYLDNYLQEHKQERRSLPRSPSQSSRGSLRMTRRAHNDGSKGRSYDYNSNNDNFTTFS